MKSDHILKACLGIYIVIFFTYLFGPLLIMSIASFNSTEFPSVTPWECFTLMWFNEGKTTFDGLYYAGLLSDKYLHEGIKNSLIIGMGVVLLAVPIGMAAAIVLTQLNSRLRTFFYTLSISPVLFPGVVIGISTVVLWDRIGTAFYPDRNSLLFSGVFLTILGQTCFISTYSFLIFVARLQRFDQTQEEAALDLGARPTQVFRKILIPFLLPAIGTSIVICFLASFENYNTTVFTILADKTLTTEIASKVRLGINPSLGSLALTIITITLIAAIVYETLKRKEDRKRSEEQKKLLSETFSQARVKQDKKKEFKLPKFIFVLILLAIGASFLGSHIYKNDLYGSECVDRLATEKKKNFEKLFENQQQLTEEDLEGGDLGGTGAYSDIFGDPTLFEEFGGQGN